MAEYGPEFLNRIDTAIAEGRAARSEALDELRGLPLGKRVAGLRSFGCTLSQSELEELFSAEAAAAKTAAEATLRTRSISSAAEWSRRLCAAAILAALVGWGIAAWATATAPPRWPASFEQEWWRKAAEYNGSAAPTRCMVETRAKAQGEEILGQKGPEGAMRCSLWVPIAPLPGQGG